MATLETRIGNALLRIGTEFKAVYVKLGTLTGLTTTNKTNLVGAINEVKALADGKQANLGFTPQNVSQKGQPNGYAGLDGTGKVPSAQLPAFVDDVLNYANRAAFPASGATGVLYLAEDTNHIWRWSGTAYVDITNAGSAGDTDAIPEGSVNLYYTDQRADARANARIAALIGNPDADLVAVFEAGLE